VFSTIELTVVVHDTTGGMKTKISEVAMIEKLGIDVYIIKVMFVTFFCLSFVLELLVLKPIATFQVATSHSLRALNGDLRSNIPDDWLGMVVRSSR